jgi:hypothetical protein
MEQSKNSNRYDLEDRTFVFAKHCRDFVAKLSRTQANIEYGAQLIRSSGSQAEKTFFIGLKFVEKKVKRAGCG